MLNLKLLSLLALLATGCFSENEPSNPNVSLEFVREIAMEFSDESRLSYPIAVAVNADRIYWSSFGSLIHVYSHSGQYLHTVGEQGSGPGQYLGAEYLVVAQDGKPHAYDIRSSKYVSFTDAELTNEISLPVAASWGFDISNDAHLYFLMKSSSGQSKAAAMYTGEEILIEFGEIPESATLGMGLPGGGIEVLPDNSILYGFLGDHRLWKYTSTGELIDIFDDIPEYYTPVDQAGMAKAVETYEKTRNVSSLINYTAKISRFEKLFSNNDGVVLQSIATGVPSRSSPARYRLEVWNADGDHLAKGIDLVGPVVAMHENHVYVYDASNVDEKTNPSLLLFRLQF